VNTASLGRIITKHPDAALAPIRSRFLAQGCAQEGGKVMPVARAGKKWSLRPMTTINELSRGNIALRELSFDEIDAVSGANETSDALYVVAGTAVTVASVAARLGAPQVAAGAAVIGLVAFVAAAAID
jgi:hypothetical protein